MSELSKALKYLSDNACIRRDSAKFRRGREQLKAARDPLTLAQRTCISWEREKAQQIVADIWDACAGSALTSAVVELERALRQTLGGRIDPTHRNFLDSLEADALSGQLTRGVFVKQGAELFRIAFYAPDADGHGAWREPNIRGFQYHPSQTSDYREKMPIK